MLIGVPFLLGACDGLTQSSENLRVDPPSPSLTEPCHFATSLPKRDMVQSEVERFWIEDRRRLAECRGKHGDLVLYINGVVQAVNPEEMVQPTTGGASGNH